MAILSILENCAAMSKSKTKQNHVCLFCSRGNLIRVTHVKNSGSSEYTFFIVFLSYDRILIEGLILLWTYVVILYAINILYISIGYRAEYLAQKI